MPDEHLTFIRPKSGRFQIGSVALETMLRHVQSYPAKPEAGGVLLGRHIIETSDVVVDQVTTPQPGDRQERLRFFRARRRHQALIDQAWQASGETCTYLGEWHTHDEPVPTPSLVDRVGWRRKLLVDRFSGHLFFIIVGTTEVRVWEGRRRRTMLLPLRTVA